jgi:plastocyanin
MRRLETLSFAALALIGAGCGGGGETAGGGGGAAAAAAFPVDTTTAATVSGRVAFTGSRPAPQRIDMAEEASCAAKHPNGAFTEQVVVNANGTLANVFVYVKEGPVTSLTFPVPAQPVEIDQDGCVYLPRVFGIQVGQTLAIRNSDGLLHNIKAEPTANRPFNISQPTNMVTNRTFNTAEVMVPLECNVHSWMNAFVGVLSHPYHATSGSDGAFTIRRLPPGTYTLEAWHETLGTQTQQVTVAANESKEVTFTFQSR